MFAHGVIPPRSHPKQSAAHLQSKWVNSLLEGKAEKSSFITSRNTGKDRGHFPTFFIVLNHYKFSPVFGHWLWDQELGRNNLARRFHPQLHHARGRGEPLSSRTWWGVWEASH